ncbi:flagellin N-terminal helical domain-containing protein [Pelagerythrobacter marinus]|uniref:Flagellar biosynthesis protein FlgL n=1 Tax=Pelagerythrobacter marinus TaxID=538382 RepID=A0ABW9UXW7_9SPHN|nr:flagellar biosynthesis protein FlgL [Pelagerythrobacter marinus]MEC9065973.1 flagellar biosynthesis protein FlgL [Pseudomonadota bacterium]MXO69669.1 flagellar biosynthesis protein FlgL [Pelagerythrobacter marinus]USA39696.1 flagellar biosynthesis protein FlgL [Pelagerythrobacter marinus]WPZ06173.1 flagellar biosynthesis protein FlgL [Pelagerythrobacter marinus]
MINLSTSAFYDRAGRQIGVLRAEAEKLQQQVGTGQRLTRSSDDPVAAARLRTLERAERLSDIDQRNSDVATNDLAMADDALGSLANLVIRAQELATHAASETLSAEQREAIATEIDSLQDAALLIANGRNSAGHALFGGQASGVAYERDAGGVAYVGTGSREAMDLGDGQSVVPGLTGPEVFAFEVDGTPTDIFAVLGDLATGLRAAGDPAEASRDALGGLAAGLEKVTTAQTVVGARLGWVEVMDDRRIAQSERVADEQLAVGGADIAVTMTRLQEISTVLEASQASFVRLAGLSLFDMMR